MATHPISVFLTDDHPLVLSGLKNALDGFDGINVTGIFTTGTDLINELKICQPEILILDLQMPFMNGLQIATTLRSQYPEIGIIILSAQEEAYFIEEMLTLGCKGYLLKSKTDASLLSTAIQTVHAGRIFINPSMQAWLMGKISRTKAKAAQAASILTKKEKEILQHIMNGYSSKQIAQKLDISIRTVETHRFNLLQKLDVKNTANLIKKAMEWHLLQQNK